MNSLNTLKQRIALSLEQKRPVKKPLTAQSAIALLEELETFYLNFKPVHIYDYVYRVNEANSLFKAFFEQGETINGLMTTHQFGTFFQMLVRVCGSEPGELLLSEAATQLQVEFDTIPSPVTTSIQAHLPALLNNAGIEHLPHIAFLIHSHASLEDGKSLVQDGLECLTRALLEAISGCYADIPMVDAIQKLVGPEPLDGIPWLDLVVAEEFVSPFSKITWKPEATTALFKILAERPYAELLADETRWLAPYCLELG